MEIIVPIIAALAGLSVGAGGIFAYNKKKQLTVSKTETVDTDTTI